MESLSPPRAAVGSLNPVVNLLMASRDGEFPRSKMRRPLDGSIARINAPAPAARLVLLNVVINGAVLHLFGSLPQEQLITDFHCGPF
jgi:hypothetical protein